MSTIKIIFTIVGFIGLILLFISAFNYKRKGEAEISKDLLSMRSTIVGILAILIGVIGYLLA